MISIEHLDEPLCSCHRAFQASLKQIRLTGHNAPAGHLLACTLLTEEPCAEGEQLDGHICRPPVCSDGLAEDMLLALAELPAHDMSFKQLALLHPTKCRFEPTSGPCSRACLALCCGQWCSG